MSRARLLPLLAVVVLALSGTSEAGSRKNPFIRASEDAARQIFAQLDSRFDPAGPAIDKPFVVSWLSRGFVRVLRPDGTHLEYAVDHDGDVHHLAATREEADDPTMQELARQLGRGDRFPGKADAIELAPGYRGYYSAMPQVHIIDRVTGAAAVYELAGWRRDGMARLRVDHRTFRRKNGGDVSAVGYRTVANPTHESALHRRVPRRARASELFGFEPLGEREIAKLSVSQARGEGGRLGRQTVHSVRIEGSDPDSYTTVDRDGTYWQYRDGHSTRGKISTYAAQRKLKQILKSGRRIR